MVYVGDRHEPLRINSVENDTVESENEKPKNETNEPPIENTNDSLHKKLLLFIFFANDCLYLASMVPATVANY